MNEKSWRAMTGACILLATSVAQAYPILDADSGAQVSMVVEADKAIMADKGTQAHVACTEVGLRTASGCWSNRKAVRSSGGGIEQSAQPGASGTSGGSSVTPVVASNQPTGSGVSQNTATTGAVGVPEPETWALMVIGLLGAAVATRGRRPTPI